MPETVAPAPALRLNRPAFLALKSALACGVALGLDSLTGNPDHVSSTFVAILCLTPMVWLGLRRAGEQVLGAVVGCLCAAGCLWLRLPIELGVPVAVGGATLGWMMLRRGPLGSGFAAAAFTALFVQLVPFGDIGETLGVRGLAVLTGAVSGFVVNITVSGYVSRSIFDRRLALVRTHVEAHLNTAIRGGPEAVQEVFAALGAVDRELGTAIEELAMRRAPDRHHLRERRRELRALRHLVHVAAEVHYLILAQPDPEAAEAQVLAELEGATNGGSGPLRAAIERLQAAKQSAIQARGLV